MSSSHFTVALRKSADALLFVSLSALAWLVANRFNIAREEGFDPLRYEYFARSDFPEYLAESSSYTIVWILKFIYQYAPPYLGFLMLVVVCVFAVLKLDQANIFRTAIISPIAFFYIAQTGKDSLAIIAFASVAIIALYRTRWPMVILTVPIALAIFARPVLVALLPIVFVMCRFGVRPAFIVAMLISALFLVAFDTVATLETLQDIVSDEGSGPAAQMGRELTFGYSVVPMFGRAFLLFISPFIQPIVAVLKLMANPEPFLAFEGLCQVAFLFLLLISKRTAKFLVNSIPLVLVVAALSPFYHFRYMAILYPFLLAYTLLPARLLKVNPVQVRKLFSVASLVVPKQVL